MTGDFDSEPVAGTDGSEPVTAADGSEPVAGAGGSEPVAGADGSEPVAGAGGSEPSPSAVPDEVDGAVPDEVDGAVEPGGGSVHPADGIVRAALVGTAVFVVVAVAAALSRPVFSTAAVVVSLGLFAAGCVTFLWAYAIAVQRSRVDSIGMGGLFFLEGSAPRPVQRRLIGAAAIQVVVALATAAAHPFTSQAFVILAPMYGLGLAGLWGARHGTFAPREGRAAR